MGLRHTDDIQRVTGLSSQAGVVHSYSQEEALAFSTFINNHLSHDADLAHILPLADADALFAGMKDGWLPAKLVNFAAPNTIDERILHKRKPTRDLSSFEILENLQTVLMSARSLGIQLVNIGPNDLMDGTPHLVLGVSWQIIRMALLADITLADHPELYLLLHEDEDIETFRSQVPEAILIRWFNYHLARDASYKRRVNNFGKDVQDCDSYLTLLHQLDKEQCPIGVRSSGSDDEKAQAVLSYAETLGVKPFLQPSDILDANAKLNLAFVAEIFNACPGLFLEEEEEEKMQRELKEVEDDDPSVGREERVFKAWLNNMGVEGVNVHSLFHDLRDGIILSKVLEHLAPGTVDARRISDPAKMVFHRNMNCQYVLDQVEDKLNCKLINIDGQDIAKGNRKLTLGVIWQVMRYDILHFLTALGKSEKDVLTWVNATLAKAGHTVSVRTFGEHITRDCTLYASLLKQIEP
ncbi:hypothetical protein KIPB_009527, partial [Kipferlia bialata]|eukprot:g9527.t1